MVLFPAAIVVMFVLAALAVDAAVAFNARREVADIAATVANDAVTALTTDDFYAGGTVRFDAAAAADRAVTLIAARLDDDGQAGLTVFCDPPAPVSGDAQALEVRCYGTVDLIFSPFGFLGIDQQDVSASAIARADQR